MIVPDLRFGELTAVLAELVEADPAVVEASTNLFELGLDSISLMRLVAEWRRAGVEVDFAELAERPTVADWSQLLAARRVGARSRARSTARAVTGPTDPVGVADPVDRSPGRGGLPGSEGQAGDFGLAPLQHAYWVGRLEQQRLGGVAAHLYTEFDGLGLDPDRLATALGRLIERHDMLRVRIGENGRQHTPPEPGWRGLAVHDLRGHQPDEVERVLAAAREEYSHQMLDIASGEVLSTAVSLLPGGRTRFHLDVDLVAADAVSYRVLLAELAELYVDPSAVPAPLGLGYRDYLAAWSAGRDEDVRRAAGYWRSRLAELPGAPELPRPPARPSTVARRSELPEARRAVGPRVRRVHAVLSPERRQALSAAARQHGVTLAAALATAFAEVVGAWSTTPRFLLNVPLFDRAPVHPDVDRLVGDFTSTVLLAIDLAEERTFAERVRDTQARLHTDAAHAEYSGVEVLRELGRRSGEQVLAPVVFTSALNLGELFSERVSDTFGDAAWIISQGPQVSLDAQVTEVAGGLLVNWDVREGEFADGVVDAMFGAFSDLLDRLASAPDGWLRPVGDLRPDGQRAVRDRVNASGDTGRPRTLHEQFFALADCAPDRIAVLTGGVRGSVASSGEPDGPSAVSYGQLANRALRVAATLVDRGVRPGDPVGISLPEGPDQVAAVLGVLAAGGCYVPIGMAQPPVRAARMAAVAGFDLCLADRPGPGVLLLTEALATEPLAGPVVLDPAGLAYLLLTSGSTGRPKAVEMSHGAAMATVGELIRRFGIGPDDRTLGMSDLDFDLSVFDVFAPLNTGGALVLAGEQGRRDAHRWAELVRLHRVSVLNCVPSALDALLLANADDDGLSTLRLALIGGDRVAADLPGRLAAVARACRFVGLGGTTETAIHSTFCEVDPDAPVPYEESVPYGTPLSGVVLRVVDEQGRDRPDWVDGELWIGGTGVALGYRGDPSRTKERFVEWDGVRWYRTGDRARYRPDGSVEWRGRLDDQVKLRGFRVEPGEVEVALRAAPGVLEAVASIVHGRGAAHVDAVVHLDKHVAASGAVGVRLDEIRAHIRDVLPPHLLPERLLVMDELPLSPNGKLDRRAVRAELHAAADALGNGTPECPAPRDDLEQVIALMWASVLGTAEPGVTDDFFASGGDSLRATALVSALREALHSTTVTVRTVFAEPTVAGLAGWLRRSEAVPGRLDKVAELFCEVAAMSDDEVAAALEEQ